MTRSTSPDFATGMGLALAELHRLHGDSSGVCEVAKAAGLTLAELRAAGLEEYDTDELVKAGLPEGEARPPAVPWGPPLTWREYRKLRETDLKGRKVRLLSKIETKGGAIVAAGTVATIRGKRNGLVIEVPECGACGQSFRCNHIDPGEVSLMPIVREPRAARGR